MAMAVHGGGSNPQTLQFLSNVLSQRGPSALPYTEDVKWLIRQHLLSLIDSFPSLQPKTAVFTHNDGRSINLLQADGTVPMPFQGVTYNIPVVIWLVESYPRHPPYVYVNPTRDMIIKRPHPHVNPSGLVSIPCLQNWVYPSSNLLDLARNLSHYFARDPPLYSRTQRKLNSAAGPNPNLNVNPRPGDSSVVSSNCSSIERPSIPPSQRILPPSPYASSSGSIVPQRPTGTDDPNEVFKRNAVNKLVEMIHGDIVALKKTGEGEMDGLFNAQAALRQREAQLKKGFEDMQDEKEGLEQQLQMVLMSADLLQVWLRENEGKMTKLGSVNVDEAFELCDPLSKQMLDCTTFDMAIEDVIYSLDKAVQEGVMPFDQYLKNVRLLSREQFLHRATSGKIRAAQMQAQVASMAARASHYAT
ncbi:hypothetical protein Ancab_000018 [Ancistrocladus abbreviatus]